MKNCDGLFVCLSFIKTRCARVGALKLDGMDDSEVEAPGLHSTNSQR